MFLNLGSPSMYLFNLRKVAVLSLYIFTALFLPSNVFALNTLASFPVAIIFSMVAIIPLLKSCCMFFKVASSKTSSTVFLHSWPSLEFFILLRAQSIS